MQGFAPTWQQQMGDFCVLEKPKTNQQVVFWIGKQTMVKYS